MTTLSNSLLISKSPHLSSGSPLKSIDESGCSTKLFFSARRGAKPSSSGRSLSIQARYSDGGRPSNGGFFIGGFVLGGLIVGTLGCVYAPQISKAISGTDKEDIMKKLPKFIYDEEKELEKQRKILAKKIEQINSSIDGISAQLRSEDTEDGATGNPDDVEAVV
ncbi:uncharacterized protein LOC107826601 isoform X1 [Nicotiana tabacum]|uniref:Uncharacterized protein LOC107826601 isoform X1 n=2 Tax=Nicotiana TaxID=4085 RepID=A0A1S4D6U8_TOBAC|nr:PREDICTED: uncharacterized protein LOC104246971 isoform X1 [Nicotiana sylvestris]XP_016509081.1 PREDICTED: uncharacterized protein LOC107826601 isoform X1 [Nicotiana tabacum]